MSRLLPLAKPVVHTCLPGVLNSEYLPKTYRKEHRVDIQGEFDEVVEVVGFPQFSVGWHGC